MGLLNACLLLISMSKKIYMERGAGWVPLWSCCGSLDLASLSASEKTINTKGNKPKLLSENQRGGFLNVAKPSLFEPMYPEHFLLLTNLPYGNTPLVSATVFACGFQPWKRRKRTKRHDRLQAHSHDCWNERGRGVGWGGGGEPAIFPALC